MSSRHNLSIRPSCSSVSSQPKHLTFMLVCLINRSKTMQQFHDHTRTRTSHNYPCLDPPFALFFLCSIIILVVSVPPASSSCTEQDEASLLQFLAGLSQDGGLAGASWRRGKDCCKWEGITCGGAGSAVTGVSLASRGLHGNISPSLGNLASLKLLNLSHNSLSGDLPLELVSSHSITVLDVSFNHLEGGLHDELPSSTIARPLQVLNISSNLFTGQFPSSTTWKALENMIVLNASNNSFTGQIPAHFCSNWPSLVVIELCFNRFSGSVPPGLGDCSMLRLLRIGHNNLTGTLPTELFNVTSLEYLSFSNNNLHGVIDDGSITNLRNLVSLNLGGNNFSDKIPDSIGELKSLEELHLDQNNMSGELPSALSNCRNLITIDLRGNRFSGELSKVSFSKLRKLETLDVYSNNFTGKVPESIYSCSNLIALRLAGNKLHGQVSPRIGNLKCLIFLSLAKNNFKNISNALHSLKSCGNLTTLLIGHNFRGELMPQDDTIVGFENLQVLALNDCSLLGKIPLWVSKLANLEILIISDNQLDGSIPAWIKTLKYLFHINISNNSLSGEIPIALMDLPMLKSEKTEAHLDHPRAFKLPVYSTISHQYRMPVAFSNVLDLSNNKITGEIPVEIGQLKALLSLNFSFNSFRGQIPQSVCDLKDLQLLDLSNNSLTGVIPGELNNLHFLSRFNVSNNDLEGPIPSGGQFDTFQRSSFDGNTRLCGATLIHKCHSAEAPPSMILSEKHAEYKPAFMIAFGAFFGVGVLYDQIVLSRYFG